MTDSETVFYLKNLLERDFLPRLRRLEEEFPLSVQRLDDRTSGYNFFNRDTRARLESLETGLTKASEIARLALNTRSEEVWGRAEEGWFRRLVRRWLDRK